MILEPRRGWRGRRGALEEECPRWGSKASGQPQGRYVPWRWGRPCEDERDGQPCQPGHRDSTVVPDSRLGTWILPLGETGGHIRRTPPVAVLRTPKGGKGGNGENFAYEYSKTQSL